MSARIVSSLTDERADMRKQVGCMTGIFQLLDRHHFLIGRRIGGHNNKKLLTKGGHHNMEPRSVTKTKKEKTVNEGLKGKQMVSDQSSKIYPSSPTSSNLSSSLGRYRTPQLEPPSCSQTDDFPETPKKQHSSSLHLGRQSSPDIQDVVKESMHREARSVSIKAVAKVEGKIHLLKHIDSPRPLKQPSSRNPEDDKDYNVLQRAARNPPRFSCDGMESRERLKATMKLRDTPRLSLDSGLRSIKSSADQESGCYKRSSSVVAKLMGLEGFPDSVSIIHHSFFPDECSISMPSTQTQHPNLQLRPANSRLPLELAPWCQSDSSKASQIKMRKSKVPSTVFGEIEKRVTELEFQKSGKDLRALKQILEAMHRTRPRLECQKQEHNPSTKWETYLTKKFNSSIPIPKQDSHNNGNTKVAGSIDKGRAKLAPKRNNVVKEPSRVAEKKNNGRTSKSVQDHNHIQVRSPGAVSPRLQDKKQGKDKQPNFPPSDSSRLRRHQNKQPKPGPPHRRHKPKPNNLQYDDDQTSEASSDTRNLSEKGNNTASVQSERNDCLVSVGNDTTMTEFTMAPIEQPSPVSVLDASFYIEDSPSPVKKISSAFRDYEPADANETEWHLDCTRILGSEYNLVHKLSILNTDPDHEHSINQIASLCPSENIDHHYINKVVLASGILKDLGCVSTTELHPSGNLINPELFHVLEQTEGPTDKNPLQFDQKIHRKLIFDTVNEILAHKLHLKGSKRRCLSGEQLLKELYAEIDYLQPKPNSRLGSEDDELVSILTADMKHEWGGDNSEIPALALSIERLIFKDLITEVIRGDGEERSRGHCRQLFTH